MITNEGIAGLRQFWTTRRDDVYLVERIREDNNKADYWIRFEDQEMTQELTIENEETRQYVIEMLLQVNVRIFTQHEEIQRIRLKDRENDKVRLSRLWTKEKDKTRLFKVETADGNFLDFLVVNEVGRVLHLHDNAIHQFVVNKMLEAGVNVIVAENEDIRIQWEHIALEDIRAREAYS